MDWRIIVSLVFSIIIAIFAIANSVAVDINLIFTSMKVSQALVILISATIGALIIASMNIVNRFKKNSKIKSLEKEIIKLKSEKEAVEAELKLIKATEEDIVVEELTPVETIEAPEISEK